jgi:large conductance mechanosensitive channel
MRITNFWQEFKKFAFKGNMLDLAVAVVIGNAFGAVVNSLVKDVIMPVVSYAVGLVGRDGKLESYSQWHIGQVAIGPFLAELIHFLIVALAMFLVVVKLFGAMQRLLSPDSDTTNKECPFCLSVIPIGAMKCAHCTSDLAEKLDGHAPHEPVGPESA